MLLEDSLRYSVVPGKSSLFKKGGLQSPVQILSVIFGILTFYSEKIQFEYPKPFRGSIFSDCTAKYAALTGCTGFQPETLKIFFGFSAYKAKI